MMVLSIVVCCGMLVEKSDILVSFFRSIRVVCGQNLLYQRKKYSNMFFLVTMIFCVLGYIMHYFKTSVLS